MTEYASFNDVMMIEDAKKIVESYKLGKISETDCLIKVLKHFERHGEIFFATDDRVKSGRKQVLDAITKWREKQPVSESSEKATWADIWVKEDKFLQSLRDSG